MPGNPTDLLLCGVAGMLLGIWFFGGLWLTVQQLQRTSLVPLLFLSSFVIRSTVTLAGFVLVTSERWERAAGCLVGFVVARIAITVRLKPAQDRTAERTVT